MDQMNPTQEPQAEDEGTLYTIEICAKKDGSFTVEMETGAQESAEEANSESGEAEPQTADSFATAMEIANQLNESQSGGQDEFDAGFGKAQSNPTYIREGE